GKKQYDTAQPTKQTIANEAGVDAIGCAPGEDLRSPDDPHVPRESSQEAAEDCEQNYRDLCSGHEDFCFASRQRLPCGEHFQVAAKAEHRQCEVGRTYDLVT